MIQVKLQFKLKKIDRQNVPSVVFGSSCTVFGICWIYTYSGHTAIVKPAIPCYLDWQYPK